VYLQNQKVEILLKSSQKFEGTLGDLDRSGGGESFGVVLKMARDVSSPHKGVQRELVFPSRDVSDIRIFGTEGSGAGSSKPTSREGELFSLLRRSHELASGPFSHSAR